MDTRDNSSGSEQALSYDARPYVVAINALFQQSLRNFIISRIASALIGLVVSIVGVLGLMNVGISTSAPLVGMGFGFVLVVFSLTPDLLFREFNSSYRSRLTDSGLADQIGLGEIKVPTNKSGFLAGRLNADLLLPVSVLNLVAGNLFHFVSSANVPKMQLWKKLLAFLALISIMAYQFAPDIQSGNYQIFLYLGLYTLGFTIFSIGSTRHYKILLLREYLGDCWGEQLPDGIKNVPRTLIISTTRKDVDRKTRLQRMLNEVAQSQTHSLQLGGGIISASSLFVGIFSLPIWIGYSAKTNPQFGLNPNATALGIFVLIGLVILVSRIPFIFFISDNQSERASIRAAISSSNLAVNILNQGFGDMSLEKFVPKQFKVFVLTPPRTEGEGVDFKNIVSNVCFNLDWYSQPPKRLVRPVWLYMIWSGFCPLLAAGNFALFDWVFSSTGYSGLVVPTFAGASYVFGVPLLLIGASTFFAIRIAQHNRKVKVWGEELIRHLKERLAE